MLVMDDTLLFTKMHFLSVLISLQLINIGPTLINIGPIVITPSKKVYTEPNKL